MKRPFLPAGRQLLAITLACVSLALGSTARAELTPTQIDDSVRKGVEWLKKTQKPGGDWEVADAMNPAGAQHEVTGKQWGGLTAMATYALLAAGENPQEEHVAKAVNWLLDKGTPMVGTYALALKSQVWTFLPENHKRRKDIMAAAKHDRDLLLKGCHGFMPLAGGAGAAAAAKGNEATGADGGFYGYFPEQRDHYDRSNSQYGVLGMWAIERCGVEVPQKYWDFIDKAWKKAQQADGGWGYSGDAATSANMSVAGLATLYIALEYLSDQTGKCNGNQFNQEIEKALGWMDRNAAGMLGSNNYYGIYGIERCGVASGRKYFGKIDWFKIGAEVVVKGQNGDGSWGADDAVMSPKFIPNTCFAMFFLTRGRAPVVMNKLEWKSVTKEGKESGWNQRQRDCANFAHWMGKNLDGRYINWQIVNLSNPDDLHDSPILYMAGSEGFAFDKADLESMRKFVEDGGMILGNADCAKQPFVKSFRELGKKLFKEYEFRDLEQNHAIFTAEQFKAAKWKSKPKVLGLSNGVRELMLLIPDADMAKAWQGRNDATKKELFELGANIALYSTGGRTPLHRGDSYLVKDAGKTPATALKVARVLAGENSNPEPSGWKRLNAILKNSNLAALSGFEAPFKLGEGKLKPADFNVASITGTTKFKFDDKARKELKAFVDGGGTVVIDSAGGRIDFADDAEREVAEIWGDAAKKALDKPLPPDAAVFNLAEMKLESFGWRMFARSRGIGKSKVPRLKGVDVNADGKIDVFVSREDLSAGLVGQEVDGILGYDPATSAAIMRNILMYSSGAKAAVAQAQPAAAVEAPEKKATDPAPKAADPAPKAVDPTPPAKEAPAPAKKGAVAPKGVAPKARAAK